MKKVFVTLAAILFAFAVSAQAPAGQAGQGGGQGFGGGMGGMRGGGTPEQSFQRLTAPTTGTAVTGVTEEQKTKILKVYTDIAAERTAAYAKLTEAAAGGQVDREARTKVNTALTEKTNTQLNAIFNDAQKAQFKKQQEERAAMMGQGRPGGAGAPPAGGGMAPAN